MNAVWAVESQTNLRRHESAASMRSKHNSFPSDLGALDEVMQWKVADVTLWVTKQGFSEWAERFEKHQVDGALLIELREEDLQEIGITRLGPRRAILQAIKLLTRTSLKPQASTLKVPSLPRAMLQFFTFAWASTSEGKSGGEQKDEVITANIAISLVSALLTGLAFDWFTSSTNTCFCNQDDLTSCFCSAGFDLDGTWLWLFYLCSGMGACAFLCATVFAVLQIVAINEMSDDDEIEAFFDLLDEHESLPGKLVAFGLLCVCLSSLVYILFNAKLGLSDHNGNLIGWLLLLLFVGVVLYVFGYATGSLIQSVYKAKVMAKENISQMVATDPHALKSRDTVAEPTVLSPELTNNAIVRAQEMAASSSHGAAHSPSSIHASEKGKPKSKGKTEKDKDRGNDKDKDKGNDKDKDKSTDADKAKAKDADKNKEHDGAHRRSSNTRLSVDDAKRRESRKQKPASDDVALS